MFLKFYCRDEEDARFGSKGSSHASTLTMAQLPWALRDYTLPPVGIPSVIRRLKIPANNFEIKPITLQLI